MTQVDPVPATFSPTRPRAMMQVDPVPAPVPARAAAFPTARRGPRPGLHTRQLRQRAARPRACILLELPATDAPSRPRSHRRGKGRAVEAKVGEERARVRLERAARSRRRSPSQVWAFGPLSCND